MLGDLDLMQCAQKDAPTMRRLSVELSGQAKDIPSLRRVSCSSVSSARSSMSQDSSTLSPTFSSSMPNSFYLDRVTSLLGRAASMPLDRAGQTLPSIPGSASVTAAAATVAAAPVSPTRPLQMASSALRKPWAAAGPQHSSAA